MPRRKFRCAKLLIHLSTTLDKAVLLLQVAPAVVPVLNCCRHCCLYIEREFIQPVHPGTHTPATAASGRAGIHSPIHSTHSNQKIWTCLKLSLSRASLNCLQACLGYSALRFDRAVPHTPTSSDVYSTRGMGSPLQHDTVVFEDTCFGA
jgi:hypothetical protein